jgi:hypothetical protein
VIPVVLIVLPSINASLGSLRVMVRDIEFPAEQAGKRKGRGSEEEVDRGKDEGG